MTITSCSYTRGSLLFRERASHDQCGIVNNPPINKTCRWVGCPSLRASGGGVAVVWDGLGKEDAKGCVHWMANTRTSWWIFKAEKGIAHPLTIWQRTGCAYCWYYFGLLHRQQNSPNHWVIHEFIKKMERLNFVYILWGQTTALQRRKLLVNLLKFRTGRVRTKIIHTCWHLQFRHRFSLGQ